MTMLSVFAIVLLPRQFHVTVVENNSERESGGLPGCSRSTSC